MGRQQPTAAIDPRVERHAPGGLPDPPRRHRVEDDRDPPPGRGVEDGGVLRDDQCRFGGHFDGHVAAREQDGVEYADGEDAAHLQATTERHPQRDQLRQHDRLGERHPTHVTTLVACEHQLQHRITDHPAGGLEACALRPERGGEAAQHEGAAQLDLGARFGPLQRPEHRHLEDREQPTRRVSQGVDGGTRTDLVPVEFHGEVRGAGRERQHRLREALAGGAQQLALGQEGQRNDPHQHERRGDPAAAHVSVFRMYDSTT
jgi:hypothetical protein